MIYLCKNIDGISSKIFDILPDEQKIKILKIKDYDKRLASAVGYLLLIAGLQKEYNIFTLPKFGYNEFGKPYLLEYPHIHFNITHSFKAVVCVISTNQVGIDLELIKPVKESLIKYCLSTEEYENLAADRPLEFTKIWTKKESYLKCLGTGIANDLKNCLKDVPSDYKFQTMQIDNYFLTICLKMKK